MSFTFCRLFILFIVAGFAPAGPAYLSAGHRTGLSGHVDVLCVGLYDGTLKTACVGKTNW